MRAIRKPGVVTAWLPAGLQMVALKVTPSPVGSMPKKARRIRRNRRASDKEHLSRGAVGQTRRSRDNAAGDC